MLLSQINWELRNYNPYNEYFIPLIVALLLVITIRLFKPEYFTFLLRATFNNSNVLLFARQDLNTGSLYTVVLILNYVLSFSVGLAIFSDLYLEYRFGVLDYLILSGSLFALFYLKFFLLKSISWITEQKKGIQEIKYNLFLFFELGGLIMLVLAFFLLFMKEYQLTMSFIIIGFQLLVYLFFLSRGFFIAMAQRISFFYIFLYLCSLEILPLIVIFYVFSGKIEGLSGL